MGWEPGSWKTVCLWHMVSLEIVVKMSTRAAIPSEGLTGGGVPFITHMGLLLISVFSWLFLSDFVSSHINSVQCNSVAQLCPTLCNPMDFRMPGLLVHHQLPELTHTNVHRVSNAIRQFHVLLSPSPAFNLSQHQSLFQWVSSSHQMAKYWNFSFSIIHSNEYSAVIAFRMD